MLNLRQVLDLFFSLSSLFSMCSWRMWWDLLGFMHPDVRLQQSFWKIQFICFFMPGFVRGCRQLLAQKKKKFVWLPKKPVLGSISISFVYRIKLVLMDIWLQNNGDTLLDMTSYLQSQLWYCRWYRQVNYSLQSILIIADLVYYFPIWK